MPVIDVTDKELQLLINLLGEAQCKVKDAINPRALYDKLRGNNEERETDSCVRDNGGRS